MIKLPDHPVGNRICIHDASKTIYLSARHIKRSTLKLLVNKIIDPYEIVESNVISPVLSQIDVYADMGYKIVFEHDGRQVLLRYAK